MTFNYCLCPPPQWWQGRGVRRGHRKWTSYVIKKIKKKKNTENRMSGVGVLGARDRRFSSGRQDIRRATNRRSIVDRSNFQWESRPLNATLPCCNVVQRIVSLRWSFYQCLMAIECCCIASIDRRFVSS